MTYRALRNGGYLFLSSAAALAARIPLLPHQTQDYQNILSTWYGFFVANGYLRALQHDFYDYNPPYLYLLAGAAWLFPDGPDLIVIKALSIAFDFLLAYFVARCVRQRYPGSDAAFLLAWTAALLAPAVLVNSALWAQADGVYTAFLVASLYYLRAGRSAPAFLAFGLSFAVKLQAVFLLPLFLWVSRKQRVEWRYLGLAAFAYFATLLPAWFAGRPFYDLPLIYLGQVDHFRSLSERAPHLWIWLSNEWYPFWPLLVALFGGVVWLVDFAVRKSRAVLTGDRFWTLALLSMLLAPYLLPKMHERYFYPAAVVAIVFAFCRPRYWPVPVVLGFASFGPYLGQFFFDWRPNATARWGAVVLGFLVALLLRRLWRDLDLRLRLSAVRARIAQRAAEIRPAVLPLLLLLGCLAAALSFAASEGRFERPTADDPVAARTLARVANLSAEHRFVPFTRRALDGEGEVAYELDGGRPPGADLLLRLVLFHFADGSAAEAVAARAAMAVSFGLAALLAYLSLVRLLGGRWIALGVTLLAFSSFSGGNWDAVAAEGAPAVLAALLAFHGTVVFVREGRFRQLLLKGGAALFLAASAYALLTAFAALGLLLGLVPGLPGGGRARQGRFAGLPTGTDAAAKTPAIASAVESAGDSPGNAPGESPGESPVPALAAARRRFGELLFLGLSVGAALFLLGRANEAALRATGARLVPAASVSESGRESPAAGMESPAGMESRADGESPAVGMASAVGRRSPMRLEPPAERESAAVRDSTTGMESPAGMRSSVGMRSPAGTVSPAGMETPEERESSMGMESPARMESPAGMGTAEDGETPAGRETPTGRETPAGRGTPAGRESPTGRESPAAGRWRRFAASLVPYAFGARHPDGGGPGGIGSVGVVLVGVLLVGVVLVGAAFSRDRLLFLPLVLTGLFPLALPGGAASAVSAAAVPAPGVLVTLAAFALAALALTRRRGERPDGLPNRIPNGVPNRASSRGAAAVPVFVGVLFVLGAAAVFLVSGHRAGAREHDAGAAALEARIGADFDRIRGLLERRTEEPVLFAPPGPDGPPEAVSRYLPGAVFVVREDRRRLAEFTLAARPDGEGPIPDAGLLTPENSEVFLHSRAALDGELDAMIAAAGPPVIREEFEVYLHDDRLLYVRNGCRPEDREGLFVLHLDPVDPEDLGPFRRQYGFENLSFRFRQRALDLGERCVARVFLPEYPIRRMVVARHPGQRYADWIWRHDLFPNAAEGDADSDANGDANRDSNRDRE